MVTMYDPKLALAFFRIFNFTEGAHDGSIHRRQRSQCRGTARRAGGAEKRARGGEVQVAGILPNEERHAQRDPGTRASLALRGAGTPNPNLLLCRSSRELPI